ncbi:MAG: hypothetical protein SPH04_04250 [Candidatus Enterosoma sp.]|nr:hypothetical protein [Candidatus Enterosoma sp.]
MMKQHKILVFSFIVSLIFLFISTTSGLGMWLFHEGNKNTAELTYDQSDVNPEDRIRMDDIAENYYFASDLDAKDFYTIYFFAQPGAAPKTGTPAEKISGLNKSTNGYWVDPSNTIDGTQYGYKKFENVYRQLSPEQYDTLGELKCNFQDKHDAIGFFCGFTADKAVASNNLQGTSGNRINANISLPDSAKLFNLNKPLSVYDSEDGTIDNTIYLYAVYTNGVDYKNTKNNSIMFKIPEYDEYPMFFLPHKNKYETAYNSEDLDVYFTLPNIRVLQDTETKSLYQNVIYKKESGFASALSFRHLDNNGDRSNNWYLVGTDAPTLADFINNNIQANCYYNFYIYYNQRKGTNTSVLNPSSNTELAKIEKQITSSKHIINTKEETKTRTIKGTFFSHDISYYYKFYIERIYNFKLTGGITGSFDFNKSTGNVLFNKTSSSTDTYDVFETKELSFASSYGSDDDARINRTFTFNYGSNYGNIVSADEAAVYDSTNNPSLGIKNPAGGDVFYGTEDYSGDNPLYVGNFNKITVTNYENGSLPENDSAQQLPVITIAHPGVYKIRARVYYANGVPSAIKISVAYLRGLFIEVFDSDIDPSNLITGTEFINHSNPPYKAFFNYQSNPLKPDDELFQDNDGNKYSLLTLLRDKYKDKNGFYDHVGGKNIRFDARRDNTTFKDSNGNPLKGQFTLDGGQTWIDEFPITKNFIFYPVKLPEQQTV